MKIKSGLILNTVGEDTFAVPVGKAAENFHGLIRLNETGAEIWKALEEDTDKEAIVERLLGKYSNADRSTVARSVDSFLEKLRQAGLLEQ
ncbi:MAG: PqqD family protein [Oscillospiraceae bacterium]|nr:PqqD family protein [Oscillospiraceae bacterium]